MNYCNLFWFFFSEVKFRLFNFSLCQAKSGRLQKHFPPSTPFSYKILKQMQECEFQIKKSGAEWKCLRDWKCQAKNCVEEHTHPTFCIIKCGTKFKWIRQIDRTKGKWRLINLSPFTVLQNEIVHRSANLWKGNSSLDWLWK